MMEAAKEVGMLLAGFLVVGMALAVMAVPVLLVVWLFLEVSR